MADLQAGQGASPPNLRGIDTKATRSDLIHLTVIGVDFYVDGSYHEGLGWRCNGAICRKEDDKSQIPMRHRLSTNPNKPLRTPFKSSMMVPIFKPAVEKNPGLPYDHLRSLLKPYAKDYAITVALLQGGRSATKKELFGTPEDNVSYAGSIAREMRRLGHEVKLIFLSRKETLSHVSTVVVHEEAERHKTSKPPIPPLDIVWAKWKDKNALILSNALGIEGGGGECQFLTGILVATSMSKELVHTSQEVIQADAAHTYFGKYTLFSAYTSSANGNMVNLA